MFAAEVLDRYANGERDFTNYREVDFQRVNLPEINLSNVKLGEAIFSGANLIGANFSHASLRYAHINLNCNLMNSTMAGANLYGASINHADLSKSNLQDADLSEAELIDVNLSSANLLNANLKNTLLNCVYLTRGTLSDYQINSAKMRGSNLLVNKEPLEKPNLEILNKLNELCYGQILFDSESDTDNISPFVWQIPKGDRIQIDDIIRLEKYSKSTDYKVKNVNYFHYPYKGNSRENQRYNNLIEIFRNDLTDVNIYWLEETCGYRTTLDVYLIGKTTNGSFAGISVPNLSWSLSDIR
jgi:uncharacterized protein YjbI with pentapeptide repeats